MTTKKKYNAKEVLEIMDNMNYNEFQKVLERWIN